jgi:type I restriction enzyme M protein
VDRPLRLNFHATTERIARIETESGFMNLATSSKKNRQHASKRSKPASAGRTKSANC